MPGKDADGPLCATGLIDTQQAYHRRVVRQRVAPWLRTVTRRQTWPIHRVDEGYTLFSRKYWVGFPLTEKHMCPPTVQAGHHLRVQTPVPAMHLPAGSGDVRLGRDASKKGGNHLASSLGVKRGQQQPSPSVCALWEVRVSRYGAR